MLYPIGYNIAAWCDIASHRSQNNYAVGFTGENRASARVSGPQAASGAHQKCGRQTTGRPDAGGARPGGKPRPRPGADHGGHGVLRRAAHRQGRASWCPRRRAERARPGASLGLARRAEAGPWRCAHFGLSPAGRGCLDIGASTGGFTDVLLHHGAARVHAVDVGHGQLAWKLRSDPRVVVHEKTNARHLPRRSGEPSRSARWSATPASSACATVLPAPLALCAPRRLGGGADQAAIRGGAGAGRPARAWCATRRCMQRSATRSPPGGRHCRAGACWA